MSKELNETIFATKCTIVTPENTSNNSEAPFKDHPAFTMMHDTLARRQHHHLIVRTDFASSLNRYFIESFVMHLAQENIAPRLQKTSIIFLDIKQLLLEELDKDKLEKDFSTLRNWINAQNNNSLIAIVNTALLETDNTEISQSLFRQLKSLVTATNCRLIILQPITGEAPLSKISDDFTTTPPVTMPAKDNLMILKLKRDELQEYHRAKIADNILTNTYALVERYLSSNNAIESTILLLDSSAARASATAKSEVSMAIVLDVLSSWTKIPATHLQLDHYNYDEFISHTQKRIFGQDMAITLAASELQQAYTSLQEKQGAFAAFLMAGPAHSGKKTTAAAMTIQLFRQINLLYTAHYTADTRSFSDIKLQRYLQNRYHRLTEVMHDTPCAVLLFENIEKAPAPIHQALQEIVCTGYYHDLNGKAYDFRQAIIVMTTSACKEISPEAIQHSKPARPLGIGQLIAEEQMRKSTQQHASYTQQELVEKIREEVSQLLPEALCRQTCILPFFKLQKKSIEQIIQIKISALCKQLAITRSIKLEYAAEVPRFLSARITESTDQPVNIDKALKQFYTCVENTLSTRPASYLQPAKLYLSLAGDTESLNCEWQQDRVELSA